MNSKQAAKILKEEKAWESSERKREAFALGIDALESVEALKNKFIDGMDVHYECGVARNDDYSETKPKHCPECGTKLIY